MKKIILFCTLVFLFSCKNDEQRSPLTSDIIEVQSPELNLSIPEIENLSQSNISNICIPLGTIENLLSLNVNTKVSQNIVLKIIIPENKFLLFKDLNFTENFFGKIQKEVVKSISQQVKVNSILFVFEGENVPEEFSYFNKFLKKLKPLNLSIGLGIPSFLIKNFKEKFLLNIDYAVIFFFGFPYPPSLANSLLNAYRMKTVEKDTVSFPIPFYFAVSIANGVWISSNGNLENYIVGMPFNFISESPSVDFIGINFSSTTKNPQYIFEAKDNIKIGNYTISKGNNLNIMLFSYEQARISIGNQTKFLNQNYLGRYYHFYSTEENDGILNFNTWISYLKAQITTPMFDLQINKEQGGYSLVLSNVTGLYSDFSREQNYLEWEFRKGYFKEGTLGDFSRFRFYFGDEEVMPVQADKIRFYENFIAPFETIKTGQIKVFGELQGIFRISYLLPGGKQKIEILKFE